MGREPNRCRGLRLWIADADQSGHGAQVGGVAIWAQDERLAEVRVVEAFTRWDAEQSFAREEIDAEDARLSTAPFMTLDFAEYAIWREERDDSKAPSGCMVAQENELTEQIVISVSGASR